MNSQQKASDIYCTRLKNMNYLSGASAKLLAQFLSIIQLKKKTEI